MCCILVFVSKALVPVSSVVPHLMKATLNQRNEQSKAKQDFGKRADLGSGKH